MALLFALGLIRTRFSVLIILEKKVAGVSEASLARFVLRARRTAGLSGTLNVLVTGSEEMRSLNRHFRKKNRATDVLSFPSEAQSNASVFAGEIAISADIAAANAVRFGHPAAVEVKILALHGVLHLAGYDHESDNGKMARKEAALRRKLGLPSSLTERGASAGQQHASSRSASPTRRTRRTA